MAETIYDAIVVGGGPGGSSAAAFLGRHGRKVLLLEKERWPRDKTCGDAVSGKSVGVLRELGLLDAVENAEHGTVSGLTFSSPNGKSVMIPFRDNGKGIHKGYVCRRLVYDHLLWKNAAKGCEAMDGATVTSLIYENGKATGVAVKFADGKTDEFRGRIIIGADGVNSLVAREIRGADVDPKHTCIAHRAYYSGVTGMTGTIEIHFVKSVMPGYFWIFPLENNLANVGVGMIMDDVKKGGVNLQKEMLGILENNPLFRERFKDAKAVSQMKAWSLPFGSKKRTLHADNVLLVGDAAGLVDPFSGEGMGNAMLSGKLAAQVAHEALSANDTTAAFLSKYRNMLWEEVWDELMRSYEMQKLGKNEWLLNFVIGKAATSTKAREAIAETFSNEKATKGYNDPLFYVRLLLT